MLGQLALGAVQGRAVADRVQVALATRASLQLAQRPRLGVDVAGAAVRFGGAALAVFGHQSGAAARLHVGILARELARRRAKSARQGRRSGPRRRS